MYMYSMYVHEGREEDTEIEEDKNESWYGF